MLWVFLYFWHLNLYYEILFFTCAFLYKNFGLLAQQFDNSFNTTGYNFIKHKPTTSSDVFNAFDFMSDGSIIVAGGSEELNGIYYYNKFPLYKITPGGTLDNTFQTNGLREIKYSDSCNLFCYALKVTNANKIIALVRADSTKFKGSSNALYVRFNYLIKLNADGTNDVSYNLCI